MYEPVLFGGGPQSRRSSISAPVRRSNSQSPHIILSCVTSVTSRLSLSSPAKYRVTTSPTFISCSFIPLTVLHFLGRYLHLPTFCYTRESATPSIPRVIAAVWKGNDEESLGSQFGLSHTLIATRAMVKKFLGAHIAPEPGEISPWSKGVNTDYPSTETSGRCRSTAAMTRELWG